MLTFFFEINKLRFYFPVLSHEGLDLFDEDFGSRVSKLLFENVDDITASEIQDEIEYSIVNYEPRVDLIDVTIHPNYDNYEFDAVIRYQIIGADVPSQELQFALQPTR